MMIQTQTQRTYAETAVVTPPLQITMSSFSVSAASLSVDQLNGFWKTELGSSCKILSMFALLSAYLTIYNLFISIWMHKSVNS